MYTQTYTDIVYLWNMLSWKGDDQLQSETSFGPTLQDGQVLLPRTLSLTPEAGYWGFWLYAGGTGSCSFLPT